MLVWEKAPGGKRYAASMAGHLFRIVKQNTAAGGPRWKAYHENANRVIYRGDNFQAAKAAVETAAARMVA